MAEEKKEEEPTGRAAEIGLHNLRPKPGSRKRRKRIGRGEGSGKGKTSGRGHKGQGQRSGNKRKVNLEGGQNPIQMRMRKLRGPHMKKSMPFENFRTRTQPVNVSDLEERFEAGAEVTPETLRAAGLATRKDPVKILARGDISKALTVRAHGFSGTAREKIEAAGGTCEVIEGRWRQSRRPSRFQTFAASCCSLRQSSRSTGSVPTSRYRG
jgi:large subunit ribosomal protein L15